MPEAVRDKVHATGPDNGQSDAQCALKEYQPSRAHSHQRCSNILHGAELRRVVQYLETQKQIISDSHRLFKELQD